MLNLYLADDGCAGSVFDITFGGITCYASFANLGSGKLVFRITQMPGYNASNVGGLEVSLSSQLEGNGSDWVKCHCNSYTSSRPASRSKHLALPCQASALTESVKLHFTTHKTAAAPSMTCLPQYDDLGGVNQSMTCRTQQYDDLGGAHCRY